MTDFELLRSYVEKRDEASFQALVQRHVNLVYGTALRQLRDAGLSEDVTQYVFITLARKAPLLSEGDLSGWLYKVALLKARELFREEQKRKAREAVAIEVGTTMENDNKSLAQSMSSALDDVMLELKEKDRQVLLLRFIKEKSLREVGQALGISDDTAQKRVAKALDALTRSFKRRGHGVPTIAVTLAVLRGAIQMAPEGFAAIVSQTAVGKAGSASAAGLSVYVLKIMSLSKPQTVAFCVALGAAPITYNWVSFQQLKTESHFLQARLEQVQQALSAERIDMEDLVGRRSAATVSRSQPNGRSNVLGGVSASINGDRFLWSEDSPFVHVPRDLLDKIKVPSIQENGELSADMARVLNLGEKEVRQVNQVVAKFLAKFSAIEQARFQPTEEHPSSMRASNVKEQKSLIREPFEAEYARIRAELQTELEPMIGAEGFELLTKSSDDRPEISSDEAARAKRITVMRLGNEADGDETYLIGEEFQFGEGNWGSARIQTVKSVDQIQSPFLKNIFSEWKGSVAAP